GRAERRARQQVCDLGLGLVERGDPVDAGRGGGLGLGRRRLTREVVQAECFCDGEPARGRAHADQHVTASQSARLRGGLRGRFVHVTCISRDSGRGFPHPYWIGVVIVRRVLEVANRKTSMSRAATYGALTPRRPSLRSVALLVRSSASKLAPDRHSSAT